MHCVGAAYHPHRRERLPLRRKTKQPQHPSDEEALNVYSVFPSPDTWSKVHCYFGIVNAKTRQQKSRDNRFTWCYDPLVDCNLKRWCAV